MSCKKSLTVYPCLLGLIAFPASSQIAFHDVSTAAGLGATASESWGASWGDYDGDLYPDLFSSNHRMRATLFRNDRDGTFTEVSEQVDASSTPGWTGWRANPDTHGVTWGDIDNDGDDDLYQSFEVAHDRIHYNRLGVLTDRSLAVHLDGLAHRATRQVLFFDFNRDGRLDLASIALTRPGWAQQRADGTFGAEISLSCADDGLWAQLADLHSAPGLELVCGPRNGTFPRVTAFANGGLKDVTAVFPQVAAAVDAATLDHDGDRRADLFVLRGAQRPSDASQFTSQRFEVQMITTRSEKSVTFRTSGTVSIVAALNAGTPLQGEPGYIDIGSAQWSPTSLSFQLSSSDTRNWGIGSGSPGLNIGYLPSTGQWRITQGAGGYKYSYLQVASTASITGLAFQGASSQDRGMTPLLYRNTSSGLVPVSNAGLSAARRCQSVVSGDFDNDMDEDLYVTCTAGSRNLPNRLLRNDGQGRFAEVAGAGGAAGKVGAPVGQRAGTSESVAVADYDLDGFLDLLVTNGNNMLPAGRGGPKQLFRNRGNGNHWLEIDLQGTTSNRDGVGAQVYIRTGAVTQYREQNGGYHRWSQNSQRIHVGLAGHTTADVTVRWPNGSVSSHDRLGANRLYRLRQDGTSLVLKD
jgi:hypothetical protein